MRACTTRNCVLPGDMTERLLSEINHFLAETGMKEHRFGFQAVRNGRLVERLRAGGRIWPEAERQVRAFMIAERKARVDRETASAANAEPAHKPLSSEAEVLAS